MSEDRVDLLIIAALLSELEAAKAAAIAQFPSGPGVMHWDECGAGTSTPYWRGAYADGRGGAWSVALARPTTMGGRATGTTATNLVAQLRPSCLAMCGVCAGNPADTGLGDVVVAEVAYEWDEGKLSPAGLEGDHRQFSLDPRWLRAAQEFDASALPSFGPATEDESLLWLLERLHRGQDPRRHPARGAYFPERTWAPRLERFASDGLIGRHPDGAIVISEAGTRLVQRRIYDDVDGPERLPFRVLVGPMASGSAVVKDDAVWPMLSSMGVRKIAAVEMEAATIATVARDLGVPRWLVVKGVMDHANTHKDDRYKSFAARASAEVLYALLATLLPDALGSGAAVLARDKPFAPDQEIQPAVRRSVTTHWWRRRFRPVIARRVRPVIAIIGLLAALAGIVVFGPALRCWTGLGDCKESSASLIDPSSARLEITGGVTDTWSDYIRGSGSAGPKIPQGTGVLVSCRAIGLKLANGNAWWYRIASPGWDDRFYASADAFYNKDGRSTGPLRDSPFVDEKVSICNG